MSDTRTLPIGQNWFISPSNQEGYQLDPKGVCHGVAATVLALHLADKLFSFTNGFSNFNKISTSILNEKNNKDALLLHALLNAIYVYQECSNTQSRVAGLYPDNEKPRSQKEIEKSHHLVGLSDKDDERIIQLGELAVIHCDKEKFVQIFSDLEQKTIATGQRIGIMVYGEKHTVFVGFSKEKQWFMVDANDIFNVKYTHDFKELYQSLQKSLAQDSHPYLTSVMGLHVLKKHASAFNALKDWGKNQNDEINNMVRIMFHFLYIPQAMKLYSITKKHGNCEIIKTIHSKFPHLQSELDFQSKHMATTTTKSWATVTNSLYLYLAFLDKSLEDIFATQGVDKNTQENCYKKLLFYMVSRNDVKNTTILIEEYNPDIHYQDENKQTPLHIAVCHNKNDMINLLLDNMSDPNYTDIDDNTPLHLATALKNHIAMQALIASNADIDTLNKMTDDDITLCLAPLHIAVKNNDPTAVQILLESDADINIQNNMGNTPLHLAIYMGYVDLIEILLSHQANIHIKNLIGMSTLDIAQTNNDIKIRQLFNIPIPVNPIAEALIKNSKQVTPCSPTKRRTTEKSVGNNTFFEKNSPQSPSKKIKIREKENTKESSPQFNGCQPN